MMEVRRDGSSPPFSPTEGFIMTVMKNSRDRSSKNKMPSSPLSPDAVRTSGPGTQPHVAPLADPPVLVTGMVADAQMMKRSVRFGVEIDPVPSERE